MKQCRHFWQKIRLIPLLSLLLAAALVAGRRVTATPAQPAPRPWLLALNPPAAAPAGALPADTLGLALSGGGIRSAFWTAQVLAREGANVILPSIRRLADDWQQLMAYGPVKRG